VNPPDGNGSNAALTLPLLPSRRKNGLQGQFRATVHSFRRKKNACRAQKTSSIAAKVSLSEGKNAFPRKKKSIFGSKESLSGTAAVCLSGAGAL
jgi:hypothetical protein